MIDKPFAPICPGCDQPIYAGEPYLISMAGYWHQACYRPEEMTRIPNVQRPAEESDLLHLS